MIVRNGGKKTCMDQPKRKIAEGLAGPSVHLLRKQAEVIGVRQSGVEDAPCALQLAPRDPVVRNPESARQECAFAPNGPCLLQVPVIEITADAVPLLKFADGDL